MLSLSYSEEKSLADLVIGELRKLRDEFSVSAGNKKQIGPPSQNCGFVEYQEVYAQVGSIFKCTILTYDATFWVPIAGKSERISKYKLRHDDRHDT